MDYNVNLVTSKTVTFLLIAKHVKLCFDLSFYLYFLCQNTERLITNGASMLKVFIPSDYNDTLFIKFYFII